MAHQFATDMRQINQALVDLCGAVEQMIEQAVQAMIGRDATLAADVISRDTEIDRDEVQIEENCLTALALHHPVAADLRRVTMMIKVNNELEQMADLACNIAQRGLAIADHGDISIPQLLPQMAEQVSRMVKMSLDAFVAGDPDLAFKVLASDDGIDAINADIIAAIEAWLSESPAAVHDGFHCFSAARHLEQIADHCTSIAEDVIYMVSGEIVRHRRTLSQNAGNAKT